jgi:valyl-tRNA synthetase
MHNIHDWCISRQLWWGHRIPAWYCTNNECKDVVVAREAPAACKCGSTNLEQDTDVLDTWFSSGLLPFTTLGWPAATRDLEVFYPNSLMITGFDILFFWVARMIMLGCWFMMPPHRPGGSPKADSASGDDALRASVPFREVYIHALVRDADRQKMSKTKGNVLDPIEVIGQYGTDATRFTLAAMAAPGTDIAFSESRTAGYRNFANKIWNAARFMFMNVDRIDAGLRPGPAEAGRLSISGGIAAFQAGSLEDRWILSRFNRAAKDVNESLQTYRFDEAATRIYDFFWGEFCDWYIELIKPRLNFEEGADRARAKIASANLVNLFEASLRLLHPVMPFITEEIWHAIYDGKPPLKSIALASYPAAEEEQIDLSAETEMAILQDLIVSVRNLRAELKVEPKVKVPIEVFAHEPEIRAMLEKNLGAVLLDRPANVETITFVESALANLPGARSTSRFDVHAIYEKKIDVAAERERLTKEMEKIEKQLVSAQARLGDEQFLSKAPPHVVEGLRNQVEESTILRQKIVARLNELG